MRGAPVCENRSGAEGDNYDSDILRWDFSIELTGYALRWAQKDEGEFGFPPTSLWTPIPLPNAGEVYASQKTVDSFLVSACERRSQL